MLRIPVDFHAVITSYSIHYTKLYDSNTRLRAKEFVYTPYIGEEISGKVLDVLGGGWAKTLVVWIVLSLARERLAIEKGCFIEVGQLASDLVGKEYVLSKISYNFV